MPTDLAASTFLPWEVVRHDAGTGSYTSEVVLPGNPPVDALHGMDGGDWLLSVQVPTDLGGTTYDPRDLVRFDGVSYTLFFDGAANGIPVGANVDAAFLDGGDAGDPVVSFDAPATVGGTTFGPADLVRFATGGASLFFDAGAAGVPAGRDVSGADQLGAGVALTFDVPTDLAGTTYLPGELVEWDGAGFSLLHADAAWPLSSRIQGFSLEDAADGPGVIPPSLTLSKVGAGVVNLAWTAACGATAADYGIYEGALGSWYSHALVDCTDDGGDLNEDVTPAAGSRYFLVVPHDAASVEGSYGKDSANAERPVGTAVCQATRSLAACP